MNEFTRATRDSDDKSEAVKRGNKDAFTEQRRWLGPAKPGYLNYTDEITKEVLSTQKKAIIQWEYRSDMLDTIIEIMNSFQMIPYTTSVASAEMEYGELEEPASFEPVEEKPIPAQASVNPSPSAPPTISEPAEETNEEESETESKEEPEQEETESKEKSPKRIKFNPHPSKSQ